MCKKNCSWDEVVKVATLNNLAIVWAELLSYRKSCLSGRYKSLKVVLKEEQVRIKDTMNR